MSLDDHFERLFARRKQPEDALPLRVRLLPRIDDMLDRDYAAREDAAGQHEERVKADAARRQQRYDEWIKSWTRGQR